MTRDDFVDVHEVAKAYRKSVETIRRWCRVGAIQGARRIGRDWIIPARYTSGTEEIIFTDNRREEKVP